MKVQNGDFGEHYENEEKEFSQFLDFLIQGRQKHGDFRFLHIGAVYWGIDDSEESLHYLFHNNEITGFAWYDAPLSADLQATEGQSDLETQYKELLNWLINKAKNNSENQNGDEVLGVNCFEDDKLKLDFLIQNGFKVDPEDIFLHQVRSLENIPDPNLPSGFIVRLTDPSKELEQRVQLHNRAFSTADLEVKRTRADFQRFVDLPGYNSSLLLDLVAVSPSRELASFAIIWVDLVNKVGYLEPVGTSPDYRRLGLARETIYEGLRRIKELGCNRAIVLSHGEEARETYEALGFELKKKEFVMKKTLK